MRFFHLWMTEQIVHDGCEVWTPSELNHLPKHWRVWVAGKPRGLCELINPLPRSVILRRSTFSEDVREESLGLLWSLLAPIQKTRNKLLETPRDDPRLPFSDSQEARPIGTMQSRWWKRNQFSLQLRRPWDLWEVKPPKNSHLWGWVKPPL